MSLYSQEAVYLQRKMYYNLKPVNYLLFYGLVVLNNQNWSACIFISVVLLLFLIHYLDFKVFE